VFAAAEWATLRAVWPELSVVKCWKTSTSRFYLPQLQECLRPGVEIFPCEYGSTESPIGLIMRRDDIGSLLDVTCAFSRF
jgi:hypothetical protein